MGGFGAGIEFGVRRMTGGIEERGIRWYCKAAALTTDRKWKRDTHVENEEEPRMLQTNHLLTSTNALRNDKIVILRENQLFLYPPCFVSHQWKIDR